MEWHILTTEESTGPTPSSRQRVIRWRRAAIVLAGALCVSVWLVPHAAAVEGWGLQKVLSRVLVAVVLLVLVAALGVPSWRRWAAALGERPFRRFWAASLITLVLLGIDALLRLVGDVQEWRSDPIHGSRLIRKLVTHAVGATVLACFEEWLFRGWLWRALARRWGELAGALLGSLLFAWLHYFRVPPRADTSQAFDLAEASIAFIRRGLEGPLNDAAPGVGLFLFALALCLVVRRTGGLAAAIGVHASVVFFLKMDGGFFHAVPDAATWFYGSRDLVDGLLSWLFIAGGGAVLLVAGRRRTSVNSRPT